MTRLDYFKQVVNEWKQEDIDKADDLFDYMIDWADWLEDKRNRNKGSLSEVDIPRLRPPIKI